jgi:hypothetical protein
MIFGFLGDMIGGLMTGGQQGAASRAAQEASNVISGVELPDVTKMRLQLEQAVQQGLMTPEQAATILQEQSGLKNISVDPRLKNAQMAALQQLQDVGTQGGITAVDRAQLNQIAGEEATRERGNREAILQNAQQRGVGGSGMELMNQMMNQQNEATNASNRGFDVAANAQARALQAMQQSGQLGGQMQSNEFNQQAQIAAAQDAINKFNTSNQNQTNLYNTGAMNQAQAANLAEKQRIADANANLSNSQQAYNKSLEQTQYNNAMEKAAAQANALNKQSSLAQQQAGQNIPLIGGALKGVASYLFPGQKKDEEEVI